jgi:hypothetical protein
LATQWQTTAMTNSTVTTQIHQTLDIHGNFTTQVAFYRELTDFGT